MKRPSMLTGNACKLSQEAGYTDGIIESLAYLCNERFDKRDLKARWRSLPRLK